MNTGYPVDARYGLIPSGAARAKGRTVMARRIWDSGRVSRQLSVGVPDHLSDPFPPGRLDQLSRAVLVVGLTSVSGPQNCA